MSKDELYNLTIPVYDKHLDEKKIDGLIEFYQSETGKAYVEKMPIILKDSMQIGAAWGQKMMIEIFEELKKKGYEVRT